MTATTTDPGAQAYSLAFQIENGIHKAGTSAGNAVDQMFQHLADAGWRWEPEHVGFGDPMPVHADLGERLEYKASLMIREQLSNAVLAFWLDLRRTCQVEHGSQESIGFLVEQLAGVVAGLVFEAGKLPPSHGSYQGPAKAVEVAATTSPNGTAKGTRPASTPPAEGVHSVDTPSDIDRRLTALETEIPLLLASIREMTAEIRSWPRTGAQR